MANGDRLKELLGQIKPVSSQAVSSPAVSVSGTSSVGQVNVISDSNVYFSHPNGGIPVAIRPGNVFSSADEETKSYNAKSLPQSLSIDEITELAKTLAALETLLACHEVYLDSVWRRLIEAMGLAPGAALPTERFMDAKEYLQYRILLSRKDATRPRPEMVARSRQFRVIHDIAKRYGLKQYRLDYLKERWGVDSMRLLEKDALDELESHFLALERRYET